MLMYFGWIADHLVRLYWGVPVHFCSLLSSNHFINLKSIFSKQKLIFMVFLQDYGIDFDDHDQPVKLFQCKCGSKFCRNMKRSNSRFNFSNNLLYLIFCWIDNCWKGHDTCQIGFFKIFNLIYFVVELGRQLICLLDCLITCL